MYEFTDRVIAYLNRRFIEIFGRLKQRIIRRDLAQMDEITVLNSVNEAYIELEQVSREMLGVIAEKTYTEHHNGGSLAEMWLTGFLDGYSPVTRYVFSQEVGRKRARLYEALVASKGDPAEIDKALRYWSKMVAEYAVEVTDAVMLQAMTEDGLSEVQWYTAEDERVCKECGRRHGLIYPINAVPPKPHWGCRCYLLPVN